MREHLRQAVDLAREAQALQTRWKGSRGIGCSAARPKRLDAELDRLLGALDAQLDVIVRTYGPDAPEGSAATRVRERLFPRGVGHLVHLPYVEEAEQVESMLARVDADPELANELAKLHGTTVLERVREAHARYAEALQLEAAPPPAYAEVEQAREALHERYCAVVSLIVGLSHLADSDSAEGQALARAQQVVLEQDRSVGIVHRRRRGGSADEDDVPSVDGADESPHVANPPALPSFDVGFEDEAAA
ncbi:MAG: hypothetical protein R3F62_29505 [Planctomycetota bacterium]